MNQGMTNINKNRSKAPVNQTAPIPKPGGQNYNLPAPFINSGHDFNWRDSFQPSEERPPDRRFHRKNDKGSN